MIIENTVMMLSVPIKCMLTWKVRLQRVMGTRNVSGNMGNVLSVRTRPVLALDASVIQA